MKIIIYTLVLFGLTACGSDHSYKDIFSSWAPAAGSDVTFDLTQGNFRYAFQSRLITAAGNQCVCSTTMTARTVPAEDINPNYFGPLKTIGVITTSSCTYSAGTGSGTDPGCAALNSTSTYEYKFGGLQVCGTACAAYR